MKSVIRIVTFLIITQILIGFFVAILSSEEIDEDYYEEVYIEADSISDFGVWHSRKWQDPAEYNDYFMAYALEKQEMEKSSYIRNNYEWAGEYDYSNYWGYVYRYLSQKDSAALQPVVDSLMQVATSLSLNRVQLANMVVSFVQDIPYAYIKGDKCTEEENDAPCLGNMRYGLLAPIEFLYTLKGDCDTRTTLLYNLLNRMKLKTVVFISDQYAHAMLGINIPSKGDYLKHKGLKYYFWETTNIGWQSGMLPQDMNNLNYWKIALDHEF